ncbi:MAG: MCE family protein [Desulfovibrionaceae bacterium]|nr:MCE family protein [Desulfovibrionaceae bacterium]
MQSQEKSRRDLFKAALTLVLGLVILGVFIVVLGGHRFWESLDRYDLRFHNVKDLSPGRPVKYSGIDVGRILEVGVDPTDPRQILVVIGVEQGFTLYQGTIARISQKGLVGDNHVLLELPGPPGPRLAPGAELPTVESLSMGDLAAAIGDLVTSLTPRLEKIASGLEVLVGEDNQDQLRKLLAGAPELMERAGKTLERIDRELTGLSATAQSGIGETRSTVRQVGEDLSRTLEGINAVVGSVHQDWTATTAQLREQIRTVGETVTALTGQLRGDLDYDQERFEEVLDNVNDLARDLRGLANSLRERPWQVIYRPGETQ